jgi:hypothetical protein
MATFLETYQAPGYNGPIEELSMTFRLATALLAACACLPAADNVRELPLRVLHDKIAGGWAGQMIGVSFGAPTEFKSLGRINEGALPPWTPGRVSNALEQDDLYVDMTFAKVLDDKGLDATTDDFGAMFREAKYPLWHANLSARRNLKRGISAEDSGRPAYNAHANDIDFQIESDFIGLMAPGLFQSARDVAYRAGRVMNYGEGIYGGMFVSGMYSAAFFEDDPREIVATGLAGIPPRSRYAMLIGDVLRWSKQYPDDWKKVWRMIEEKWDRNDPCPSGALEPFNIDARLNGAYVALGLLYGGKDFGRTLEIATRSGQDSDCNPSTAGGILGVVLGYDAIPDRWKGGIPAIADRKFAYTDYSFHSIVASTEKRALALIERNGGGIEGDRVRVKVQAPEPPKLEVWDYGTVHERIATSDPRWKWTGPWKLGNERILRSTEKGAEAEIDFMGTGVIVVGPYLPDGGKADVYLDGKLSRTVDVNSDEGQTKDEEDVWHAFGLKEGRHTVRLVVRGEPYGERKGTTVAVQSLVLFR